MCDLRMGRILPVGVDTMDTEQRDGLISKISRLYYLEELNQKAISEKLNISLATVSRNLTRAKERGIVEIVIHDTRADESELEVGIEKQFRLKECVVTHSFEKRENTLRDMGQVVGEVLSRVLHPGDTFGVSWGETLRAVADNLAVDRPRDVNVIPIIGAMGEVETGIYPNAIAASFAQKLGGKNYLINAPAVLDSEEIRDSIERDRNFAGVRAWWNQLTAAIVSVSSVEDDTSVSRYQVFTTRELGQLRQFGVACATNFNFVDANGASVTTEIDRRMIKMNLDELRAIRNVILVACGEEKVAPIRAALSAGFADILVVDRDTAHAVLHPPAR